MKPTYSASFSLLLGNFSTASVANKKKNKSTNANKIFNLQPPILYSRLNPMFNSERASVITLPDERGNNVIMYFGPLFIIDI